MIVNSINTLSTSKAYTANAVQNTNLGASEPSFGGVAQHGHKVGKKAVLAAMALAALTATAVFTSCAQVNDPTPIEEPTEPENPVTPTPARQAMDAMLKMVDTLGLKEPVSPSMRAVDKNYVPASGDITKMSYHDDYNSIQVTRTLDTKASTTDNIVYSTEIYDEIYEMVTSSCTTTITKTKDGLLFKNSDQDFSMEYVVKDGYVMVYKIKADGTKTEYERQYPGDTSGTVKVTAPDGSPAAFSTTLSNYTIEFAK